MKKAMLMIMTVVMLTSVACMLGACNNRTKTDDVVFVHNDDEVSISYRNYTPKDSIVEGDSTAKNTIERLLGKQVEIGEECEVVLTYNPMAGGREKYLYYCVDDVKLNNWQIFYLYNDDTSALEATETAKSFIVDDTKLDPSWKNEEYHNDSNFADGAFAWSANGTSEAILTDKTGVVTSIWAYESSTNEVHLIWCNSKCPIWAEKNQW